MLHKHITIELLTSIQIHYLNKTKAYICAKILNVGKDRIYRYYRKLKEGLSIFDILKKYEFNKSKCGRQKIVLSSDKLLNIELKLKSDHSLDSICGRDKLMDTEEKCSTKTLYRIVKDGYLSFNLLRRKGRRKHKGQEETRGKITNCKTILDRDIKYPRAKENLVFGHFEGDTIVGEKRKSAIVTLVDKHSKFIILLKASRKSKDVYAAILNWSKTVNLSKVKSIIFDRGKEFAKWKEMEESTKIDIFFSDPGSPGQRGLNENSNGIVRKDLPKSTDLSKHSQKKLNEIANKWNSIPRKSLGYFTPKEVLKMATEEDNFLPVA